MNFQQQRRQQTQQLKLVNLKDAYFLDLITNVNIMYKQITIALQFRIEKLGGGGRLVNK